MPKLYIIGIGFKPLEDRVKKLLLDVPYIIISTRLVEVFKNYEIYPLVKEKLVLMKSFKETMSFVEEKLKNSNLALLASGDPLYFGIGVKALEKFGEEQVEIYPDLNCLQKGLSLIKKPWHQIKTISLHGRAVNFNYLISLLKKEGKVCILTDSRNNPSFIAQVLLKKFPQPEKLTFYVFERLGYPEEKVFVNKPQIIAKTKFKDPNFFIINYEFSDDEDIIFGLEEKEIAHQKGMITKDEIRAIVIHKLRLPEKGIIWDIGAGSGSVSLEIARLNPKLKVYAIEKGNTELIEKNKNRYYISNLEIIKGIAPECLKNLPSPNRVFIGGSGNKLKEILEFLSGISSLKTVVLTAVTLKTLDTSLKYLRKNFRKVEVFQINVTKLENFQDNLILKAKNPIFIIRGIR
ncbi:precorrin-6y C5,15-methyltransferase (decarboxylating) subunit CbiE [Thermodesulfobacterium hydrogeniphilum]|uniref:precorrin-6y C5,15-methyltransferase (decarboxylating) subunit CbiE n=1 Tax=Thermodesulfobacterium hydrogeniphilum TaxID=161156 RepID=UPI000A025789|nr:precorrin-6y C5,15-methyltransferase (decarboxylating) subunit CbiE [Thermodesulfobacterium hydrogeniphilum]